MNLEDDIAPEADQTTPRMADYPFSGFDLNIEKAVRKLKGRPKHCGVNAFRHLRNAWKIAEIAPEMALFSAITAEEEAATALIFALKIRGYPGADKLNPRDHPHKAGLAPFLSVVEAFMAQAGTPTPRIQIKAESNPPRIDIHIPSELLGLPAGHHLTPDEPLNLLIREGEIGVGQQVSTFVEELQAFADLRGERDVLAVIMKAANLRNQLLYASDNGIAFGQNVDLNLTKRRRPTLLLLGLTIIVLQSMTKHLLVIQTLEAYVNALGKSLDAPFDFDSAVDPSPETLIHVEQTFGQTPRAEIRKRLKPFTDASLDFNLRA